MVEPVTFMQIFGGFQIGERVFVHLDGLKYILILIRHPGESIFVVDLYWGTGPLTENHKLHDCQIEKCRQNVKRSITAAIAKIIECEETIGRHLQNTITTGYACRYTGDWEWEL